MSKFVQRSTVAATFICLAVLSFTVTTVSAGDVRDVARIQQHVTKRVPNARVLGLHKQRDGAYLVITNLSGDNWGRPYSLLKLESGQWVINAGQSIEGKYEILD